MRHNVEQILLQNVFNCSRITRRFATNYKSFFPIIANHIDGIESYILERYAQVFSRTISIGGIILILLPDRGFLTI